jgi:hypothetical protein
MLNGTRERGREAFLAGCKKSVCDMLMRQQVLEKMNEDRLKSTRLEALQDALQIVQMRQGT